jgi:asparagine synthase (glutamine-hydrolysing)
MCGVISVWNRDGAPVDMAALSRAATALRHRGPDDEGYVLIDTRSGRTIACAGRDTRPDVALPRLDDIRGQHFDLALAHRRLVILDDSPAGHQPMSTEDGAIWLAFNGMIYNFAEIRSQLEALGRTFRSRTDTEVVLRSYEMWGPECVERFNGMWAFTLWDGRTRRLFASRDRLGIKPLVYHVGPTAVAVSSELKGLAALPAMPRVIDPEALHHYLSLMTVPAPFTIYSHARKLLPGHSLIVDARSATDAAHWRPEPRHDPGTSVDAIEELHGLLRDSVRLQLVGDARVGTLLSGGVDSSVVSALAADMTRPAALPTYHLTFPGAPRCDESGWAEQVSAHLSTDHHRVPLASDILSTLPELVGLFDEPFAVSSVIGVYLLAREAAKRVKVLLTGDGGDELFAGYLSRYAGVDALWDGIAASRRPMVSAMRGRAGGERVRWEPFGLRARVRTATSALGRSVEAGRETSLNLTKVMFNDVEKRALYTPQWRDGTRRMSTAAWLGARLPPATGDRLRRWQIHDVCTSLHDEMLTKVDKATMASGVEARVPLLDHRLVEFALGLPAELKIAEGQGKWILKKVGERYLPRETLYRAKRGFDIPLSEWFRGDWRTFVRDTLSPTALRRVGVLQPREVERVIAHHESRPGFTTSHMVFTLLCLQIWHDTCLQRTA